MKRGYVILFLLLFYGTVATADVKFAKFEQQSGTGFVGYVQNEIVIKLDETLKNALDLDVLDRGETGVFGLDQVGQQFNAVRIKQQFKGARKKILNGKEFDLSRWYKIKFAGLREIEAAVIAYKNINGVLDAQLIGIHSVSRTPNDANFDRQWHLDREDDHDVDAPEAWDFETGDSNVIVAVMDTGVRYFHKDLGGANASFDTPTDVDGNMWVNWTEKNGTEGVDDDENGYVDDWVGWDFVHGTDSCWEGEDCTDPDNDPRDFNGHGTHCAGNLAAINNNGYATCSPAGGWGDGTLQSSANGVKVMACRIGWSAPLLVFPIEMGYVRMDFAAEAFHYAADNGAKIASCSWGSSESGGLGEALDYFISNGGIVFKAAGNDGNNTADYMGDRTDIVNVAASDSNDCKADFSNYGTWVDITAPGSEIWSTGHVHDDPENDYITQMGGTSMSTPLAAGVAAMVWSQNTSWNASQVKQQIFDTADYIDDLSCNVTVQGELGAGRINAFNAMNTHLLGDVNNDGLVNSTDASIILDCAVGLDVSQFCPMNCGDVNGDGLVNSTDASIILDYAVGLSVPFAVGEVGCPGDVTLCSGCN